jgi:hypothetical protein
MARDMANDSHVILVLEGHVPTRLGWPRRYVRAPDDEQTTLIAQHARTQLAEALHDGSPSALVRTLGWRLDIVPIGTADSTIQSVLVPLRDGSFSIVLNANRRWSREQTLWLMAHEMAHSLFYSDGAPPRRIGPNTTSEEEFCDRFADLLMDGVASHDDLEVA